MLKDNELIGVFAIYRQEVRAFTDKQIELVKNFAAQAVIAIENARLLAELRARTNELSQSVGELQALGEVSQAVNSTLDLETVLTTIVDDWFGFRVTALARSMYRRAQDFVHAARHERSHDRGNQRQHIGLGRNGRGIAAKPSGRRYSR
jgi:hypothetical protein